MKKLEIRKVKLSNGKSNFYVVDARTGKQESMYYTKLSEINNVLRNLESEQEQLMMVGLLPGCATVH